MTDTLRALWRPDWVEHRIDCAWQRDAAAPCDCGAEALRAAVPAALDEVERLREEVALLRELREDCERWRESGGDRRDQSYILDTLERLEAHDAAGQ